MTDISPNQNRGVVKFIMREGEGDEFPLPGSRVKIHYRVSLLDGTILHSTEELNTPLRFSLGREDVVKVFDIGVATMKKGEADMFISLAEYSNCEIGCLCNIFQNERKIFFVTLLGWKSEDLSEGLDGRINRYHTLVTGKYNTCPRVGDLLHVHLVGQYKNRIFEERDVSFIFGEGSDDNIISGIEIALRKFNEGEKSRINIKSEYAFGEEGHLEWDIPPFATVDYTVTLKSVEKLKKIETLSKHERLQQAENFKQKATAYFKNHKYELAFKYYKKIETFLESLKNNTLTNKNKCQYFLDRNDRCSEANYYLLEAYLNMSQIALELKQYLDAKNAATKALKMNPTNIAALFWRGRANLHLGMPELADKDFKRCFKKPRSPRDEVVEMQLALFAKILAEETTNFSFWKTVRKKL